MELYFHERNNTRIAEIISEELLIHSAEAGFELMITVYYQDCGIVVLHEKHLAPAFFDLKNGMAGELFQKFSNYRMKLAIVGDFAAHKGESIRAFMLESNKGGRINFVKSLEEGLEKLAE